MTKDDTYEHYSREELIDRIKLLEGAESVGLSTTKSIIQMNGMMEIILKNLFVAIVVKDVADDFKIVYCNHAAESFFGMNSRECVGKRDSDFFTDPKRMDEIRNEDEKAIKGGKVSSFMALYVTPDHIEHYVNYKRVYVSNPAPGVNPLLLAMIWDITEQRKRDYDLIRAKSAEKMKNDFIANMSHEIRTPLNAIVGFAELLTDTNDEKEKGQYIATINENCNIMIQIINDILDLSKIQTESLTYNHAKFSLKEVCNEAVSMQRMRMGRSSVKLIYNMEKMPDITLDSDQEKVKQVLLNLMSNAFKFTMEGSVTLQFVEKGNTVHISVTDTGIGIPKDKFHVIFERFVKLDHFRQGTGLGLTICKNIAVRLGGNIEVKSELGKGSSFTLVLPLNVESY